MWTKSDRINESGTCPSDSQGGYRMKEQIKEILLKQLQLLQEKSEKAEDVTELAALTVAMSQLLNSVDKMQTYGYLD
jgi:hypothetical protein